MREIESLTQPLLSHAGGTCPKKVRRSVGGSEATSSHLLSSPYREDALAQVEAAGVSVGETTASIESLARPRLHRRFSFLSEGSVQTSALNLVNATLGAGIVAIPYAFLKLGILLGGIVFFLFAALSVISTYFLVAALNASESKTSEELAYRTGGQYFAYTVEGVSLLFNFSTAVGYLICAGDIFDTVAKAYEVRSQLPECLKWLSLREIFLCTVALTVLFPASSVNKIGHLRHLSFAGFFGVEVLVVATIFRSVHQGPSDHLGVFSYPGLLPSSSPSEIIRGLALVVFAFVNQSNVPAVFCELRCQRQARMTKATVRSTWVALVTYTLMGIFGLLLFGDHVAPNVLLNFSNQLRQSVLLLIAFVGITVGIISGYPLCLYPCRQAALSLEIRCVLPKASVAIVMVAAAEPGFLFGVQERVFGSTSSHDSSCSAVDPLCVAENRETKWSTLPDLEASSHEPASQAEDPADASWRIRYIICFILVFASVLLSIAFTSVASVFSLTGASCGSCIAFIFPAIFFLGTVPPRGREHRERQAAIGLIVLGTVLGVMGTLSESFPSVNS